MFVRRLETLATHLEQMALQPELPRRFDLGSWFSNRAGCGTTACAVGEACFIPEFKRAGLRLVDLHYNIVPRYKRQDGWDAARAFFGITSKLADRLFSMLSYPEAQHTDPKAVAKRIRGAVKRARRAKLRT